MKYFILHPLNGELNHDGSIHSHSYEMVAQVEGGTIDDAYNKAQNHNPFYSGYNKRSTSAGDILLTENLELYMVEIAGFSLLCNCDHLLDSLKVGNELETVEG